MKKEKQILTIDLYENLIEINKEESINLKIKQLDCVDSINDKYANILESKREIRILRGKIRLEKKALRYEERRLFKTNFKLISLNKKISRLNKLFASEYEEEVDTSKLILSKRKK